MVRRCEACGAAVPPGMRFCVECGRPLATSPDGLAPPSRSSPVVPVAERRVCSILFVDLVGFTPLSESRDAEEVREILSRYFETARRTIGRYGGVVEKFIGDAVMAVWGTPAAQEGDTERSVRAALELVEAVAVLGGEVGAGDLRARAGVVTGEVAVTLGAESEGMVAGDAVNTAARVQSVASPGSVLVDATTRRLAEPAIVFADAGTFELKGKTEPERLYVATRVVGGVGGLQWAAGLEAPLVGRDVELRAVKDLFHACVERRTPRLVVVSGPAGVGKSRLGWEFENYLDGLVDTVLWHRGRCLSYGEGVAFWALAEIVRQRLGIAEEDQSEVAAAKLAEGLVRFVSDSTERDYVGVRLSRLLGVPYPSTAPAVLGPEELYAGWRVFLEALARVAPVVLVVEDAQHADAGLLGFVDHLIDWTRDLPVFVLVLARPGHPTIEGGWGIGRNRSSLSLDPLDDASMDRLVDGLVPGMPEPAREVIVTRAQGIPLFAAETVRSLVDQGAVAKNPDGSFRLAGELGELSVPDSLHGLLAARLDALPPDVRALVADASVLGTSFPPEAVGAVSGRDEATVATGLAELVRRDVLEIIADRLSPERGSYRFSQELLRQVAYQTLSRQDRKTRHLAVAAHLRATFANDGEEIADAIARHYLDALDAAPHDPDAETIRTDALSFLVRAAERAARSGAPARAAHLYAQAAGIAPPDEVGGLWEQAGHASYDAGQYEAAVEQAVAARDAWETAGKPRAAGRARSLEGGALRFLGRHEAARTALEEGLAVLRQPADADTVTALGRLATLESYAGNPTVGHQLVREALGLAQALGLPAGDLAGLFVIAGINFGFDNRLAEAAAELQAAAHLAEQAGDDATHGRALLNLADALARSDPAAGADAARSAVTLLRRTGRANVLAVAVGNLAEALIELGEWDQAATLLDHALTDDHLDRLLLHYVVGMLAGLRGDPQRAGVAQDAVGAWRASEDPQDQAANALLDTAAALANDDTAGALGHALTVLDHTDQVGIGHEAVRWAWPLAARAARTLDDTATLNRLSALLDAHPVGHQPPVLRTQHQLHAALTGADTTNPPTDDQIAVVADAVEAVRQAGNPYHHAHALIDHAQLLTRAGQPGAQDLLDQAAAIADQLGCPPLHQRAAAARTVTINSTQTGGELQPKGSDARV
jgi:class 3 adenylate cyclase/tetratricopeptide (TPR) repeat protein